MHDFDYSVFYGRYHDDTEAHAEKMAAGVRAMLEAHAPTDRSAQIVDIGCGYGFALRALTRMGYQNLLGLETSAQQAARCQAAGFPVVVVGDSMAWLNQNRGRFAFALVLDVLEHIPVASQIQFASAIRMALKPEGRALLTVPNANALLSSRWRYNDHTHHCSFTEHSLFFVLKNAGFENVVMVSPKGIGRFPRRIWRRAAWTAAKRWVVRWCWMQAHKAEIPWENLDDLSFELNLTAVATNP
jgi:2-polyprenyl-3-methyl-5-hydroxy-6-metoxy-1,4-benzoquinol methylase